MVGPCLATSLLGRGGGITARLLADWCRARPAPLLLLSIIVPAAHVSHRQDCRTCWAWQGKTTSTAAGLSGIEKLCRRSRGCTFRATACGVSRPHGRVTHHHGLQPVACTLPLASRISFSTGAGSSPTQGLSPKSACAMTVSHCLCAGVACDGHSRSHLDFVSCPGA